MTGVDLVMPASTRLKVIHNLRTALQIALGHIEALSDNKQLTSSQQEEMLDTLAEISRLSKAVEMLDKGFVVAEQCPFSLSSGGECPMLRYLDAAVKLRSGGGTDSE